LTTTLISTARRKYQAVKTKKEQQDSNCGQKPLELSTLWKEELFVRKSRIADPKNK
jgi:hypothetical protein